MPFLSYKYFYFSQGQLVFVTLCYCTITDDNGLKKTTKDMKSVKLNVYIGETESEM